MSTHTKDELEEQIDNSLSPGVVKMLLGFSLMTGIVIGMLFSALIVWTVIKVIGATS